MSSVDLGYSTPCEPWQISSCNFPSKIGGKPAWLNLENLPTPDRLQCSTCQQPLAFLCQIYAPYEDSDENFHRTIFIFICRNSECCQRNTSSNIKAFRNSLPRGNKFYSYDPPDQGENSDFLVDKWVKLCGLCGCRAEKQCSKCKIVSYCSREHQVIDWKDGHKTKCGTSQLQTQSGKLFPESEIVIEGEEHVEQDINEEEEMEKFNALQREGKAGTMPDFSEDLEQFATCDSDKIFTKFKEVVGDDNDQILRYERGGQPLWIADNPKPASIPDCENCGSCRQFEFQVMPQLFAILHDHELDVGVIAVYTCTQSCTNGVDYKEEYVFKQDVAVNAINSSL